MTNTTQKIALSMSRDIPFNKLVLSQSNVRRIKAGVAIEELAEDIARRTLLQSLTVRPVLDGDGNETGMYEIPAGGRRYRALQLLIKQKRLPKTAPIPCIVRAVNADISAEEDSLAENVQRAPLHPLDQFRAFMALREKGQPEEEIAAAFFVSVNVVRQRLRLAAVSPKLLDVYGEDGMTLDQLMGFTVNPDHERQEQVWEALQHSYNKEPCHIRRLLTEGAVRASDKRAQFVGTEAYEKAGGTILRDLFEPDDGGWLQEPPLLEKLVAEKLEREADTIRAAGWKWIEVVTELPYGYAHGLRQLSGREVPLTDEETAARDALQAEFDDPEDEPPLEDDEETEADASDRRRKTSSGEEPDADEPDAVDEPEEDDGNRPLSDRLMTELTAHRTLALREAVANDPDIALRAALHALCLKLFYHYGFDTCLEIEAKSVLFGHTSGLADTPAAKTIDARHKAWDEQMPEDTSDLWDMLAELDSDSRQALFAHCVGLTINAVHQPYDRRPKALRHADRLASAVALDMADAGWTPTVDAFLGRVTKARILEAVREAKGEKAAERIAHLKKAEMAKEAERLLDGTGWLPEPLRTAGVGSATAKDADQTPRVMAAE
jgi:ParB family chromosome partitioning protein